MKYHLILFLFNLSVTTSLIPDNNKNTKRESVIQYRRLSPSFPMRRNSRGQLIPLFHSTTRVLYQPNERFFILRPRFGSSRAKRPISRLVSPSAANYGTSSLRSIDARSTRNFRMNRFFTEARRNKSLTMPFRSNTRMSTPRRSLTYSKLPRRINVPPKFFPRETAKRIHTNPGRFPPYPGKFNLSIVRSTFGDEAGSSKLAKTQRALISGRHVFRPPIKPTLKRTGDTRTFLSPASHPKSTNVGITSRILVKRPIRRHFGSLTSPRSRLLSSRKITASRFSRPIFKDTRSPFRSSSARIPFSYLIPGFRSFDKRVSPWSWADTASVHTVPKSTLLIANKSRSLHGDSNIPRSNTSQITALFIETSPAVTTENIKNSAKVFNNSELAIIDQFTSGNEDANGTGSVSIVKESLPVSKVSDEAMVSNQTIPLVNGVSDVSDSSSRNTTQDLASTIDSGRPNAEAPAQTNWNVDSIAGYPPVRRPNVEKLTWLTSIVDTREGLEEATDDGELTSKLKQFSPNTYTEEMAALHKEFRFSEEFITDMNNEGNWEQFLSATGNTTKDQVKYELNSQEEYELIWPTETLATKKEQRESKNDGRPVNTQEKNESSIFDKIMAEMRRKRKLDSILSPSGLNSNFSEWINRKSEAQNAATNKIKNGQTVVSNPAVVGVPAEQREVYRVSIDHQMT